ncbi:MAG TPA: hypothetical protein VHV55_12390 [Pirellulales bacterium]|nr:hypothetical protein [Pirellulales bacterium]
MLILATPFCSAREIFFAHASRRAYNRAPRQRAQRDDARRTSMESERSIAPENQSSNARSRRPSKRFNQPSAIRNASTDFSSSVASVPSVVSLLCFFFS